MKDRLKLREVAPVADMDAALLSKVEKGIRLPTREQLQKLAAFYSTDVSEWEAKRLAEKYWRDHADNPAATAAASLILESAGIYAVNKSGGILGITSASKTPARPADSAPS